MANFWNRRKNTVTEAQEYLRSTDSVSRPMALLLSLLGFLIVFAIVFSIFLGGRWLWQKITEDDSVTTGDTIQIGESPAVDPLVTVDDSGNDSTVSVNSGMDDNSGVSVDSGQAGGAITVNGSSSTITDGSAEQEAANSPVSSTDVSSIPRTGPADTVLLLVAVTVIAGTAHNVYARVKQ